MQYYILMPGDTEADALNEANCIGESSFNTFWAGSGLKVLMRLVEADNYNLVNYVASIITEKGKHISIGQFFKDIEKLKVKYN